MAAVHCEDGRAEERNGLRHVDDELDTADSGAQATDTPSSKLIAGRRSAVQHMKQRWLVLAVVWALSAAYMGTHLKRGWVPHDEGAFAESAERVLNGELPHRDFDEIYTGGLAYLHALAFRELGTNLASMRYVLFAFFLAWVPTVFYIATRFLSNYVAGAIALLAVAWSVPNYAAAVPSWYNLFFATFGVAALLRYLETDTRRWLFVAGLCGGFSILAKVVGVFYVAAVGLFLIFREQYVSAARDKEAPERSRVYRATITFGLALFIGSIVAVIRKIPQAGEFVHFVLPSCALAILLLHREFAGIPGRSGRRIAVLFRMILPFATGVLVPVLIFLVPYFLSGAVHALLNGLFVLPAKRLSFAQEPAPALVTLFPVLSVAGLVFLAFKSDQRWRRIWAGVLALGLGVVLIGSAKYPLICEVGWYSLADSIPVIAVAAAVILGASRFSRSLTPLRQQQLMLMVSVTALSSLVQFPFSGHIYFCYVAPLAVLAAAGIFATFDRPPRLILGTLVTFSLLFVLVRVTPSFIYVMGKYVTPDTQTERLTIPRAGGLRVDAREAALYEAVIALMQKHARGQFAYAAPDCPEVYFLAGLQNPTRTLFDFLDDPSGRIERILSALETHHVDVVAIKQTPGFSEDMDPTLEGAIEERYPNSEDVGEFEVRWRE